MSDLHLKTAESLNSDPVFDHSFLFQELQKIKNDYNKQEEKLTTLTDTISGLVKKLEDKDKETIQKDKESLEKDTRIFKLEEEVSRLNEKIFEKDDKIRSLNEQLEKNLKIIPSKDSPPGGGGGGGNPKDYKNLKSEDYDENTSEHLKILGSELKSYRLPDENDFKEKLIKSGLSKIGWMREYAVEKSLIPVNETNKGMEIVSALTDTRNLKIEEIEKLNKFGKVKGLSSAKDITKRYSISISITTHTNIIERVTDPNTGESLRANDFEHGPPNYQITWDALKTICSLVLEHGIPMERIEDILQTPYFSSSNISRWIQEIASWFLESYLKIFHTLHKYKYLKIDDTNVSVLSMKKEASSEDFNTKYYDISAEEEEKILNKLPDLSRLVATEMGRVSSYKNEKGVKHGINLTLVIGELYRTEGSFYDSRDTLYLYRTHFGQAGNLLSRILEEAKDGVLNVEAIYVQSDRSAQNFLENDISKKVKITEVGCYAHARRPFVTHIKADPKLCNYILVQFLKIAHHEKMAFTGEITTKKILDNRKEEEQYWEKIKSVCESVVEGAVHPIAKNAIWPKETALHIACKYILTHYTPLTVYLANPYLKAENNHVERSFRIEKKIEDSSKFRKSEEGRVGFDIIRSIMSTCQAAEVEFSEYMKYAYKRFYDEDKKSEVLLPNEFRKKMMETAN